MLRRERWVRRDHECEHYRAFHRLVQRHASGDQGHCRADREAEHLRVLAVNLGDLRPKNLVKDNCGP